MHYYIVVHYIISYSIVVHLVYCCILYHIRLSCIVLWTLRWLPIVDAWRSAVATLFEVLFYVYVLFTYTSLSLSLYIYIYIYIYLYVIMLSCLIKSRFTARAVATSASSARPSATQEAACDQNSHTV